MKDVQVKITKQLEKDLRDLEKCASECESARMKKTLMRVSKNMNKHLRMDGGERERESERKREQRGGMAPLNDPAIYNMSGFLNQNVNVMDAGDVGNKLMAIPPPFTTGTDMNAGNLFSDSVRGFFMPGGSKKKRTSSK